MPSPIFSPTEKFRLPSSPVTGPTALFRRFRTHPCCRSRLRPQSCTPCSRRSSARPTRHLAFHGAEEPTAPGRVCWALRGTDRNDDGETISSERKPVLPAARGGLRGPVSGQRTAAPEFGAGPRQRCHLPRRRL